MIRGARYRSTQGWGFNDGSSARPLEYAWIVKSAIEFVARTTNRGDASKSAKRRRRNHRAIEPGLRAGNGTMGQRGSVHEKDVA